MQKEAKKEYKEVKQKIFTEEYKIFIKNIKYLYKTHPTIDTLKKFTDAFCEYSKRPSFTYQAFQKYLQLKTIISADLMIEFVSFLNEIYEGGNKFSLQLLITTDMQEAFTKSLSQN